MPTRYTRRSTLRLGSLGLLSAIAGCTGSADDGGDSTPTSDTTTNPPHVGTECGFGLDVEKADDADVNNAERILQYENLNSERQKEFRAALKNGYEELSNGTAPFDKGAENVIEYEGEYYQGVVIPC